MNSSKFLATRKTQTKRLHSSSARCSFSATSTSLWISCLCEVSRPLPTSTTRFSQRHKSYPRIFNFLHQFLSAVLITSRRLTRSWIKILTWAHQVSRSCPSVFLSTNKFMSRLFCSLKESAVESPPTAKVVQLNPADVFETPQLPIEKMATRVHSRGSSKTTNGSIPTPSTVSSATLSIRSSR